MANAPKFYSSKEHYNKLWEEIAKMEEEGKQPTIGDAVRIMQEMGNTGWVNADAALKERGHGEPSFEPRDITHEMCHLMIGSGHTPYQEEMNGIVEEAFHHAFHNNHAAAEEYLGKTLRQATNSKIRYYYGKTARPIIPVKDRGR